MSVVSAMLVAVTLQPWLRTFFPSIRETVPFHEYALLAYLALPLWLALVFIFDLHRSLEKVYTIAELVSGLLKLHGAGLIGLSLLQFLTQSVVNRSLVLLFLAASFTLMFAMRRILGAWARFQHRHGYNQERFVLVGAPTSRMRDFVREIIGQELPPKLVGYVHDAQPPEATGTSIMPGGLPWLGPRTALAQVLHETPVDHVLFFPPYNRPDAVATELSTCESLGVAASVAVDLVQLSRVAPRVTTVGPHPFVTFDEPVERSAPLAVKYGLDPLLAAALLILASPILLATALSILITMGRPVLFIQQRAGLYGRPFRMLKFRSMVASAEQHRAELEALNEMQGPTFKLKDDPRITKLGRFIRKTSIDELPQLFNVLLGTMTLVGPRPLPLAEQEQIRGFQRRRLAMKPGITCLWQISGRSDLTFDEWMLLDLKYIDEWSLGLDLTILLKTLPVVLLGRGAR